MLQMQEEKEKKENWKEQLPHVIDVAVNINQQVITLASIVWSVHVTS